MSKKRKLSSSSKMKKETLKKTKLPNLKHEIDLDEEEQEIEDVFPNIGLAGDKPDFLFCMAGNPTIVVETKNDRTFAWLGHNGSKWLKSDCVDLS